MKLFLSAVLVAFAYAKPYGDRLFGGAPCTVTGNILFINGLETRNLTSAEMQELSQYQQTVTNYNEAMKAFYEQRKQEMRENYNNQRNNQRNGPRNQNGMNRMNDGSMQEMNNSQLELPTPPARPSFCSDDAITVYMFDGCLVQNNKVYIGKQFARDLTSSEVQELQTFNTQLENYENYLQQQLQSQMNSYINQSPLLSQLFNGGSSPSPSPANGVTSSPGPAPQAPTAPIFCTNIY